MTTRHVKIGIPAGAHARPVAELARLVLAHGAPVRLTASSGETVDLSSVLAVMDLALAVGDAVTLHAEGPDADAVLDALAAVLAPEVPSPR